MIEGQLFYIIKKLNQYNQEGVYDDVENALIAIMGFIDCGCDDANKMGTIERKQREYRELMQAPQSGQRPLRS